MAKPMYVWNGSAWEAVAPTVPQSPIAYQASAPASPSTGDIWVDSDGDVGTFDRQLVRYRFVASGGETSLSGVDANGFTLAYVPGAEQVYLNGVLLVRTSDYTATNGTSITALSPALAANDVVEVFAYNSFNLANTYTQAQIDGGFATKAENGLVHINTTSFSAVASQSINDVFSSTYDNYRILFNNITWSSVATTAALTLRLRSSGTDTSANYTLGGLYMHHNSTTITGDVTSPAVFLGNTSGNNGKVFGYIEIYSPKLANETSGVYFKPYRFTTGSSGAYTHGYSFFQTDNTQFDGFSLVASAGAINGSVSIYGYKK